MLNELLSAKAGERMGIADVQQSNDSAAHTFMAKQFELPFAVHHFFFNEERSVKLDDFVLFEILFV